VLLLLVVLGGPSIEGHSRQLFVIQYSLVSERPTEDGTEYVFRARLLNLGAPVPGAIARLTGSSPAATILDGSLTFGPVDRFGLGWSVDTASIRRHGRWLDIIGDLRWVIDPSAGNRPPEAAAGPDRTVRLLDRVVLDGSASTDPDGDPLTYRWSFVSRPAGSVTDVSDAAAVRPEFLVDRPGRYVVALVVNDGRQDSAPDLVEIATTNTAPVADAGPDQRIVVGAEAHLDGSASSDPDGDALTYSWQLVQRPAGSQAVLDDPRAVRPTFVVDVPGSYAASLTVSDGSLSSAPDTIDLTTDNTRPTADAGPDQHVTAGQTVVLDGSGSTDVDGNPLTYTWSLVSAPAGSAASILTPTAVISRFTADVPGEYVAQLVVNDGALDSLPDTVLVSTANTRPLAAAGPDQTVTLGQVVVIDGSNSSDADGDPLTFRWTMVSAPAGSSAAIQDPTAAVSSFVADRPGDYVLQLFVNDGLMDSDADALVVSTANSAPIADAGPDRTDVPLASPVELDGSGSSDPDGQPLRYTWSLIGLPAGSTAGLTGADTVTPSLTPDRPGTYVAQLIVNDGVVESAPDTVSVSTVNGAPVADAGADQTVPAGSNVQLDGTGSLDPEGAPLSVRWTFVAQPIGSTATLTDPALVTPTFLADVPGTYTLELVVDDGVQASAPDSVIITATAPPAVVSIAATDPQAGERGPDAGTLTVNRSGSVAEALTVALDIDGTAEPGMDFQALPATVTIPAGATAAVLTILPVDDALFESTESVDVTLLAGSTYVVGAPSTASVTIADDDTRVSVRATDPTASENGADTATFTLSRVGDTSGALDVSYALSGTALPGADFALTSGIASFAPGAADVTVVVVPLDDTLLEGPETVTLTLQPGAGYQLDALDRAGVTILDDERPSVTIVVSDGTSSEAGPDPGSFEIARTGPTALPLVVEFSAFGAALEGVDYQRLGGRVTIPAGASSVLLPIVPIDDSLVEGAETVVVTLTSSPDYVVVVPGIAGLPIADDDLGVVSIEATDASASEAMLEPGLFTLRRTGDVGQPLTVLVGRGGTVVDGDYEPIGAFVAFPAGSATVTVPVIPRADNLVEGPELFTVTILPNLAYVVGAPASATVTIADDPTVVTLIASASAAAEAGLVPGAFQLTRSGGDVGAALSVSVAIGGTGGANVDYAVLSGVVTFPAGQTAVTIPVRPLADNVVEGDETVVMTLNVPVAATYVVGAPSSATVTITDDPAIVEVLTVDADAAEAGLDPAAVLFRRSGGNLAAPLNVFFQKTGTATNGADYANLGGAVSLVVIPAGQLSATVTVTPVADNLVEPSESAILTLVTSAAYQIGTPDSATVTIADDPPVVDVVATDPDASEAGPDPGAITFTRRGGNLAQSLTAGFTRSGTATLISDYGVIPSSVTIPAGQPAFALTITPVDDALVEGAETVVLTLNGSGTVVVGAASTATVTIGDND